MKTRQEFHAALLQQPTSVHSIEPMDDYMMLEWYRITFGEYIGDGYPVGVLHINIPRSTEEESDDLLIEKAAEIITDYVYGVLGE